jgi:hypothetical protein
MPVDRNVEGYDRFMDPQPAILSERAAEAKERAAERDLWAPVDECHADERRVAELDRPPSGDIDGDGVVDFVEASRDGRVTVLLGRGGPPFARRIETKLRRPAYAVAIDARRREVLAVFDARSDGESHVVVLALARGALTEIAAGRLVGCMPRFDAIRVSGETLTARCGSMVRTFRRVESSREDR